MSETGYVFWVRPICKEGIPVLSSPFVMGEAGWG